MRVGDQHHIPAVLSLGKPRYPLQRSWVGLRAGYEGCGKSHPSPEFDSRTVQPVASPYADYALVAHILISKISIHFYDELNLNVLATIRHYNVNPRYFLIPNGMHEENINISKYWAPIIQ